MLGQATPQILIIEDNDLSRKGITKLVEYLGYTPYAPATFEELKKSLVFQVFDSVLIDLQLSRWNLNSIGGKKIKDGSDIATFYRGMHGTIPGVYSAVVDGSDPTIKQKINMFPFFSLPKPLPKEIGKIRKKIKPFLKATDKFQEANPLLVSLSVYDKMSLVEKNRAYKKVCHNNQDWLNFNFQTVGDHSWAMICGRRIDEDYYGPPLNEKRKGKYNVKIRQQYPDQQQLNEIAKERESFPFIIWDTREIKFLEAQFKSAGEYLRNIPEHLRQLFGIAVAPSCAEAYTQGHTEVLRWCKQLPDEGQLETLKLIFKKLVGKTGTKKFLKSCEEIGLIKIVEIYKGRVDKLDLQKETAWVELNNLEIDKPVLAEPFHLKVLRKNGIKEKNQQFEFTVYERANNDLCSNFELLDYEKNPFDSLLEEMENE